MVVVVIFVIAVQGELDSCDEVAQQIPLPKCLLQILVRASLNLSVLAWPVNVPISAQYGQLAWVAQSSPAPHTVSCAVTF